MKRALLTAALTLLIAAPAQAETFQVNTTADTGTCNAVACSLRGAIAAAQTNGTAEADTINVPAGTYAAQESVVGNNGVNITIVGAGANSTFWEPSGTNRMLTLNAVSTSVTITVTVRGMTLRNGRPASGNGGNIALPSGPATLTLVGVRVTGGQAVSGGGVLVSGVSGTGTALNVSNSLIDNNTATGTATNEGGGGVFLQGQTASTAMTLTDSTIALNTAARGGGVYGVNSSQLTMRGGTIAYNSATVTANAGGLQNGNVIAFGSIIAGNTGVGAGAPVPTQSNCQAATVVTDQGGNVENTNPTQCDLTASSRANTDPQLATALDVTQQPPTLNIPETSPAFDFATCDPARTADQRGMTRPLGVRCDSGAYEFDPRPETAIAGAAPPFTLTSTDAGSTFQCDLDGAGFAECTSPYSPAAGIGPHTLAVRAIDPQGYIDPTPATTTFTIQPPPPTPTPTTVPTATPTPTPQVNKTVVVRETQGRVKVKLPRTNKFVDLDATLGIPVGSEVDTKKGQVELTSVPKTGAPPEKATFFDGIFKVTQSKGITSLTLSEKLAACPKRGKASAAATKPKKRKLWGNGKGAFRTVGKYSAATVRGTKWLVEDSCSGTLTRVTQGAVTVRDTVKRRTVVVRAKNRYLARPKR